MDLGDLISLVKARPILWHLDHKWERASKARNEWKEIGRILNVSPNVAKSKWKYLRDRVRKEIKKNGTLHSTWPLFKKLSFIHKMFEDFDEMFYHRQKIEDDSTKRNDEKRRLNSDESFDVSNSENESENEESYVEIDTNNDLNNDIRNANVGVTVPGMNMKSEMNFLSQQNVDDDNRSDGKVDSLLEYANMNIDEDVAFFYSLLPHIKTLDPMKKFELRTQIQNLVCHYVYLNNN